MIGAPYKIVGKTQRKPGSPRPVSFRTACIRFPNRFTLEHIPDWYKDHPQAPSGKFAAPQYRTDEEWYNNTEFPGEGTIHTSHKTCFSTGHTYPLGKWLDQPFTGV